MQYLVICAGCAECRGWDDESILSLHGPYPTVEAAKKGFDDNNPKMPPHLNVWREHDQGGLYITTPSSEEWIIPVPDNIDLSFIKPFEQEKTND